MFASLTTIFIRGWEKALFLIALLCCLFLCTLATHYFTYEPEEQESVGHSPVAISILPWRDQSFFNLSVPKATAANPFAHTLVNQIAPPQPPKQEKPEPPKKEQPTTAKTPQEPAKAEAPKKETPVAAQAQKTETKATEKPSEPPPPPPKPDIVFTIAYRGYYVDVRGESLAMLIVTDPAKKESRLFCKKGTEICGKVTLQSADETKAVFADAAGNATSVNWNNKHTFTFKQE